MFSSVFAVEETYPPVEEFMASFSKDTAMVDSMGGIVDEASFFNLPLAFEYGQAALALSDSLDYPRGRAFLNYLMSRVYQSMGMSEKAFELMEVAIDLNVALKDSVQLAWCYNNLAVINQKNSMMLLAEKYFLKAHQIFKDMKHPTYIPYPLINLGGLYNDVDRDEEALEVYKNILREYPDSGNHHRNAVINNNIGNLLWEMGRQDTALVVLYKALELKYKWGKSHNISNTLMNIGKVHIDLGNFDSSRVYLDSARVEAIKVDNADFLLSIQKIESSLAAAKGNYKDAYALLLDRIDKTDSVTRSKHENKLQELMGYFEVDQKNSEIELLQKDNELFRSRQRFQIFAIGGLLLLLVLLSGFYWNHRKLSSKVKKAYSDLSTSHRQISNQQAEILAQKKNLEQKNQSLEDLVQEKEGLIGIVAHDLKAPFNKTNALMELMKEQEELSGNGMRYVDMVQATSGEAMELIESLLMLSTLEGEEEREDDEKEVIPLNELIQDRAASFSPAASKKSIVIQTELCAKCPTVLSVPRDLERILDNLISNAIKFSSHGKEIQVGVGRHDDRPSLYVKDSGPGLTDEDRKRVFKRFQKLSARPTGGESSHGLGLAIVKSLADRLKGEMALHSVAGEGATFEFIFAERDIS